MNTQRVNLPSNIFLEHILDDKRLANEDSSIR